MLCIIPIRPSSQPGNQTRDLLWWKPILLCSIAQWMWCKRDMEFSYSFHVVSKNFFKKKINDTLFVETIDCSSMEGRFLDFFNFVRMKHTGDVNLRKEVSKNFINNSNHANLIHYAQFNFKHTFLKLRLWQAHLQAIMFEVRTTKYANFRY